MKHTSFLIIIKSFTNQILILVKNNAKIRPFWLVVLLAPYHHNRQTNRENNVYF